MIIPFNDINSVNLANENELVDLFKQTLRNGHYVFGVALEQLEKSVAQYIGCQFAIGVNSGTDALFLALKSLNITEHNEVITVANAFIATAGAIAATGATPVFVDILENHTIDPDKIEQRINAKTKAIIPIHLTGQPAPMDQIMSIADAYKIPVIEDAAQALGAEYQGNKVGAIGKLGCFSFHPFKIVAALGDAGMITTNDEALYQRLIALRNHGLLNGQIKHWGYNSRLDTLQATFISHKFTHIEKTIKQRRNIANEYNIQLGNAVKIPHESQNTRSVYQTYIIHTPHRNELSQSLHHDNIETAIHYPIPLHLQPIGLKLGYQKGDLPVTEDLSTKILSLPIYPNLQTTQIKHIANKIRAYYQNTSL